MQTIFDGVNDVANEGLIPKDQLFSINDTSTFEISDNAEKGFESMIRAIKKAKSQILIETFVWDKRAPIVKELNSALLELGKQDKNIDVFILIDELGMPAQLVYNGKAHQWPHDPKSLGFDDLPPNIKVHVGVHHHNDLNSTHAKLVLIDGETLFLTGANFQMSNYGPNANYDAAIMMKGPVANSSFYDFDAMWKQRSNKEEEQLTPAPSKFTELNLEDVDPEDQGVILFAASKARTSSPRWMTHYVNKTLPDDPINMSIMRGIEQAQHNIRIAVPNLNVSYLKKQLADFINKKGGEVEIIVGKNFNDKRETFYGGTNDYALKELRSAIDDDKKQNLRVVWYARDGKYRNIHLKLWTIDDQVTYFGSTNLDVISLFNCHEAHAVIDNAKFTKKMVTTLFNPAFENSIQVEDENLDKHIWQPFIS